MPTPLVAGNWKMNTTLAEAVDLASAMRDPLDAIQGVEKVICPPFISLKAVKDALDGSSSRMGAQNMHYEERGAFTGEVSPRMVADLCQYVILGHSERRQRFWETDEVVNRKVRAALAVGLRPILCVGEGLEEREEGLAESVVTAQLHGALSRVSSVDALAVAYEPIWAIGTGVAATGEAAEAIMGGHTPRPGGGLRRCRGPAGAVAVRRQRHAGQRSGVCKPAQRQRRAGRRRQPQRGELRGDSAGYGGRVGDKRMPLSREEFQAGHIDLAIPVRQVLESRPDLSFN